MKIDNNLFNKCKHALLIGAFSLTIVSCNTNRPVTRDDVQENIEEAQEAVEEANEATQKAIESREQYTADQKETRLNELETRLGEIDKRINDLRNVSKESENQSAVDNVNRAIVNLEDERRTVTTKLEQIKSVEEKDWSTSYNEIDEAVKQIESELNTLSESIKQP